MDREIKFRAWDDESMTMLLPGEFSIGQEEDNGFHAWRFHDNGDFIGLKLMQFTGLKDKNGTEIYEGDIISYEDLVHGNRLRVREVKWTEEGAAFFPLLHYCDNIEIRGNKFESNAKKD